MPLSDHEQRILDQIENSFYTEDPKFASSVCYDNNHSSLVQHKLKGMFFFLIGLILLILGVAVKATMIKDFPVLSVVGFIVMFSGSMFAISTPCNANDKKSLKNKTVSSKKLFKRWYIKSPLIMKIENRFNQRFNN